MSSRSARSHIFKLRTFSDYYETTSQEWDRTLTSPLKNGVHTTSWVSYAFVFILFQEVRPPQGAQLQRVSPHCHPHFIAYYAHQRDPWDWSQSILCNEIYIILRSTGGVDFEVDPKGLIYKNIHAIRYGHHSCYCYNLYPLFTSSHTHVQHSHNYSSPDSFLLHPCTTFSWLLFFWLISLTPVYNILTTTLLLTHFSHDRVLYLMMTPLWLISPLSQKCIYRTSYLL